MLRLRLTGGASGDGVASSALILRKEVVVNEFLNRDFEGIAYKFCPDFCVSSLGYFQHARARPFPPTSVTQAPLSLPEALTVTNYQRY